MQTRAGFPTLGSPDRCLKDRVHLNQLSDAGFNAYDLHADDREKNWTEIALDTDGCCIWHNAPF